MRNNVLVSDETYYRNFILRFCRLCIILYHRYFQARGPNARGNLPGLPTKAGIIWGTMGPPHHSQVRPELKSSTGGVITTSIPFMVTTDPYNLRERLRELREADLRQAVSAELPPRDESPTYGNCTEHPGIAAYVVNSTLCGLVIQCRFTDFLLPLESTGAAP